MGSQIPTSGVPRGVESARSLKAELAARIIATLDRHGLTVREAQARTGQAAADFSRLRGGQLDRFTIERLLGIAGLIREVPDLGEAFTMLTSEPGPDVAPYHNRQVVVLPPSSWRAWLDYSLPAADFLRPLSRGSLKVTSSARD